MMHHLTHRLSGGYFQLSLTRKDSKKKGLFLLNVIRNYKLIAALSSMAMVANLSQAGSLPSALAGQDLERFILENGWLFEEDKDVNNVTIINVNNELGSKSNIVKSP